MKKLLFALALAAASVALAQNYLPYKMLSSPQQPFRYYVDNRSQTPGGIALSQISQATHSSWAEWNALPGVAAKVSDAGFTGTIVTKPGDRFDAFSVTPVIVTSRNDPDYQAVITASAIKAITVPLAYAGVLDQCDIFLNFADGTNWSTSGAQQAGTLDVQTVMLHEQGHCLGLDHAGGPELSVMFAAIPEGQNRRKPLSDDLAALQKRYPLAGALGSPCLADGGCNASTLKCATQNLPSGQVSFCSEGCNPAQGNSCAAPYVCNSSTLFNPAFSGSCQRPDNLITQVGKPCTDNPNCNSSLGQCIKQFSTTDMTVFFDQGYCTQECGSNQPPCPSGSACTDFNTLNIRLNATQPLCLSSCRVGFADCRQNHSCEQTTNGGVCVPSCKTDADCRDSRFFCRTCDGLCVFKQNPAGQIGDPCSDSSSCGGGQICSLIRPRADLKVYSKVCALGCGKGCGTCPPGTTCHSTASGLFCLRDCTGTGTCPPGTQCGFLDTGRACIGQCNSFTDCPIGFDCNSGECVKPGTGEDGGCEPFCSNTDAGVPITPKPKDAGIGSGGSGGCGCGAAGGLELWAAAGLLLARARRKKR